jgi:hypothetical protein
LFGWQLSLAAGTVEFNGYSGKYSGAVAIGLAFDQQFVPIA